MTESIHGNLLIDNTVTKSCAIDYYGTIRTTIQKEHLRLTTKPYLALETMKDHIYALITTNPHVKYEDILSEVDHAVKKRCRYALGRVCSETSLRAYLTILLA